jgi:hypothetical protein
MKSLKQLILLAFLCIFFGSSYGQAPSTKDGNFRSHSNIGLGTSAIAGLSFYTGLQFNKSKHNVGINFYHNWHPGSVNIDAWDGASISTSKGRPDRFSQIGLFYGRSFSYKRLFYTLNVGPGYFSSIKLEYVALDPIVEILPDGSTYTIYPSKPTFNPYNGLGMVFVSDLSFFLSENSGLGLIIYSNFNSKNNMACVSLSYKHCFVNKINTKN